MSKIQKAFKPQELQATIKEFTNKMSRGGFSNVEQNSIVIKTLQKQHKIKKKHKQHFILV